MKHRAIKKPAPAPAVARPEARHADQPLDLSLLHRGAEHSRRFGEKPHWLERSAGGERTRREKGGCNGNGKTETRVVREHAGIGGWCAIFLDHLERYRL